ncbi:MAG TPA: sensor histidine kinase [Candidatus Tripitaka californicus]|uniref:sensor histidine kinase n=2 Tax=Candidatus Tripitaka californicus TaxID=3367616 RepID=UPI0040295BF1
MFDSIRSRTIILFLLFSGVPLLTTRLVGFPMIQNAFQKTGIRDLESVGHKQGELVSVWMKERKTHVAVMAGEYLINSFLRFNTGDKEYQELTSQLQSIRDNFGYKEISLADDQGKIRVSTREDLLGRSIAEFDYFREALKGNVFVTRVHPSALPIQNESGEMERGVPTLLVSGPVRDDRHRVIGVVSLRVDVMSLSREMCRVKLGETGETYLVDENGYMITESRFTSTIRETGLVKKRTALELKLVDPTTGQLTRGVQACLKGELGYDVEGYPDYRGVKVLGFWQWIPEYNWGLMSEIDVDEVYRDLYELDRVLKAVAFAFILVTVVVAVFLGRRLTAPILHLTEVSRRMSSGDLRQRVGISSRDELGHLAESFDTMAETIENNIKEMQQLHSQRMSTIGHLANGIAHHLNNPLTGMRMCTDILLNELEKAKECAHSVEFKGQLSRLKATSQQLESVMKGLLSISRISNPDKSPNVLNKLIELTLNKTANQLETSSVQLIKELSPTAPMVLGNPAQLEVAFMNLISNALDATPKGGTLTVKTEHLANENKVGVTITDTGSGINENDLAHLFDPYFILKIRPSTRCTGLELALAQLAIQSHGGTIEVDSEEGRGTTFKVKLPVYRETL